MRENNISGFSAKQIGVRLREEMEKQRISVIQMSNDIFCGTNNIYRMWTGKQYPSLYTVVLIAEYLGVSLDYLILGKNENEKKA